MPGEQVVDGEDGVEVVRGGGQPLDGHELVSVQVNEEFELLEGFQVDECELAGVVG